MGWDDLEKLQRLATEPAARAEELAEGRQDDPLARLRSQVQATFATPEGKAVLEHLLDKTLRRPSVPGMTHARLGGVSIESFAAQCIWHQAQCELVLELLTLQKGEEG